MHKYVFGAFLTALSIAGPLGLKVLAMIAGKALVISKVALTIAGVIALKKLYSSDHPEDKSFQVYPGEEQRRRNAYIGGGRRPIIKSAEPNESLGMDPYLYYNSYYSTNNHNNVDNQNY